MNPPLCFSCRCPMDPETWERTSEVPREGRAGEKLCRTCINRVEAEERAQAEDRERAAETERKLWETH